MKSYKPILLSLTAALLFTSCGGTDGAPQAAERQTAALTAPPQTAAETTVPHTTPVQTTAPEPTTDPLHCTANIERFSLADSNKYLSSPVEFVIDEEKDRVGLNVTYENYIDIYTLQNAVMDISVTGGSFALNESCINPDESVNLMKAEYCMVEDKDGVRKKYDVIVKRQVCELPIVNIYLKDGKSVNGIALNQYSSMEMYIDDTGAPEYSGTIAMTGQIKGRGHSTWNWGKKPYRIKLDCSAPILGLPKNRDWILLANHADKSLIRNTVAYEMGKCLNGFDWTPSQIPVDLFVNGEYRGVYSIGEHMEVAKSRVDIDESSEEADTGYLLEVGGYDDGMEFTVDYFHTDSDNVNFIVFKSPKPDVMTARQREYIINYINKADRAIMSGDYEEYIDTDSFCDWIIIHELTRNLDSCFRRSCFITKDKGGKLKMGPIWDFDLAFGNFIMDNVDYQHWVTVGADYEDAYITVNWCNYLMNDKNFREKLRSRWFEVRGKLMDTAMSCIDYYSDKVYKSQRENFRVWEIWGTDLGYCSEKSTAANTYELQIRYLKDFLTDRAKWIDENI